VFAEDAVARWVALWALGGCNLALNAVRERASGDTGDVELATDVIMSEVMAGSDGVKFVELYNGTGERQRLEGYELWRYANGHVEKDEAIPLDEYAIKIDGTFVISGDGTKFLEEFKVDSDLAEPANLLGDGDDVYALMHNGDVVDIYGVIGERPPEDTDWNYALKSARRLPNVVSGGPDFDSTEWEFYLWQDASPGDRL
jgi:hypothetical protein